MSGHRLVKPSASNVLFYSATKHAVTALTEGIRIELRAMKSNVRVTVSLTDVLKCEQGVNLTPYK